MAFGELRFFQLPPSYDLNLLSEYISSSGNNFYYSVMHPGKNSSFRGRDPGGGGIGAIASLLFSYREFI